MGKPVKFGRATESYAKNNFGKNPASAAAATMAIRRRAGRARTGPARRMRRSSFRQRRSPPEQLELQMLFGRHYACSLGRFRISVTTDPRGADGAEHRRTNVHGLLARAPTAQLTADQRGKLREQFLLTAPELRRARRRKSSDCASRAGNPTTLVLRERPPENPRPTFIHNRGEFTQPTERVEPGVVCVSSIRSPRTRRANRLDFRPLAGLAGESADRARDGESRMGGVLRPRAREDHRGFRLPGRARRRIRNCSTGSRSNSWSRAGR